MMRIVLGLGASWLLLMLWLQFRAPHGMTPINTGRTLLENVSHTQSSSPCDVEAAAFDTRLRGEEARRLGLTALALPQIADVSALRPPPTAAVTVLLGSSGVKVGDVSLDLSDARSIQDTAQRERNYRYQATDPMRELCLQISASAKLSDVMPVLHALLQTGSVELAVREAKAKPLPTLANAPDWYAPLAQKLESKPFPEHTEIISAELARLTADSHSATLAFRAMPEADAPSKWIMARHGLVTSGDLTSPIFSMEHHTLCELESTPAYQALVLALLEALNGPRTGVITLRSDARPVEVACDAAAQTSIQKLAATAETPVRLVCR